MSVWLSNSIIHICKNQLNNSTKNAYNIIIILKYVSSYVILDKTFFQLKKWQIFHVYLGKLSKMICKKHMEFSIGFTIDFLLKCL